MYQVEGDGLDCVKRAGIITTNLRIGATLERFLVACCMLIAMVLPLLDRTVSKTMRQRQPTWDGRQRRPGKSLSLSLDLNAHYIHGHPVY